MDRFGSANCSGDGQRHPEAAAYGDPSGVYLQRAAGAGALRGLVFADPDSGVQKTVFVMLERLFIKWGIKYCKFDLVLVTGYTE